jgi:hypothetical protein
MAPDMAADRTRLGAAAQRCLGWRALLRRRAAALNPSSPLARNGSASVGTRSTVTAEDIDPLN